MPSAYWVESPLRRDARENRDRILVAARGVFAELGIEASVEEIASRAGVGIGTLYRRFPTKDALVDTIFEENIEKMVAAAERSLAETEPWEALLTYLAYVVSLQADDRGLSEILGVRLRDERLVARARSRLRPLVERLIVRAQEAGGLRGDVVYEDISVLLWTTGRVVDTTRGVAPDFWQRHLALVVDGLRAIDPTPLPQPPLTAAEHQEAMRRSTASRGTTPRR